VQGLVVLTGIEGLAHQLDPVQMEKIGAAVDEMRGPGSWLRLTQMRRLAWVPVEDFTGIVDASYLVLGEAKYVEVWGNIGHRYLDGAFATVIKGFQSAFGLSPQAIMRAMGVMWSMGTKQAGSISYEAGPGEHEGRMLFEAPAPLLSRVFLLGFCEGLGVLFDLTHAEGKLTPRPVKDGVVALEARWTPKPKS
jgi:hypothetical protein